MSDCWVCNQKAEWKNEKLNIARKEAQLQAHEQGKTMAIIKNGCLYEVKEAYPGIAAVEIVSKHS
jgi:hypothetical protein